MKSIEERAWDYAVQNCGGDSFIAEGYIQGATEQKAIDDAYFADASKIVIDKACEWLLSQNLISRCIVDDTAFVKRFRKAMEE